MDKGTPGKPDRAWTPGPWRFVLEGTQFEIRSADKRDWYITGVPWGDDIYDVDIPRRHEAKANARLIAAAPEMAEALREARPFIEDAANDCRDVPNPADHLLDKIDALLAKINGGNS